LADRLLDHRTVLLHGRLDSDRADRAAAALMSLDAAGDEPVTIRLAVEDAELTAALALADTVDLMGVPVHVTCAGMVGGPALAVLAAADRRTAAPHARFRLADPTARLDGRASDVSRDAEAFRSQVRTVHEWVAQATGRTVDAVAEDFRARRYLSAAEAAGYGLVEAT
jgi:ATP-dependent Clp protease protease subunit